MKLKKITVGGFKNINSVTFEFQNIIALVSLNSYGKSNLLKAIDFGVDFIQNTDEGKKKMMSWENGIPLNKTMASKDYSIELEMQTTIDNKTYDVLYGYRFEWKRNDGSGARIVGEWLKIKLDEKNQKYNQYISRTSADSLFKTSETGRCNNNIAIEPNSLIINKLKAFDGLFYSEIINRINDLSVYIERHLDASSSYRPDPFIRTDIEALELETRANIPRVLFNLKKQFPDKYALLLDSFMQLFPQISSIHVVELTFKHAIANISENSPISNQFYSILVNYRNLNHPISFENMSDGAKRVFLLLVYIMLADINGLSLIAIEEPENSIHPSLLQSFLKVISQFAGDCKIIITSFSPYILQYLELSDIYLGLPNAEGVANFSRVRKSMQKTLINEASNLKVSVGDYIFDLLSSSDEDIKMLRNYFEKNCH